MSDQAGPPGAGRFPEFVGVRKGFTVYDHGRRDRVGYSWILDPGDVKSAPLCLSGAPAESVASGDFQVIEWLPTDTRPDAGRVD